MPRLGEVRTELPNVRLKFLNLATNDVVRRLADGTIDFGVVQKDAVARPLQCQSLGVMEYSLFLPEWLRGAGTGLKALETLPLAYRICVDCGGPLPLSAGFLPDAEV